MDYLNKVYKEFAEKGTEGITIFNSNHDSVENLMHKLLALHIDRIDFISSLIKKQNSAYNSLFDLISDYPDQIKFNKQLFTHR